MHAPLPDEVLAGIGRPLQAQGAVRMGRTRGGIPPARLVDAGAEVQHKLPTQRRKPTPATRTGVWLFETFVGGERTDGTELPPASARPGGYGAQTALGQNRAGRLAQ